MRDLSLKSAGYKKFLTDTAVPSTPACFFIVSVILSSYSSITGIYGKFSLAMFTALFLLSSILVISRYRFIAADKKKITACIILVIIFSTAAYILNKRISSLLNNTGHPEYIVNSEIVIDDIIFKRHSTELYFNTADYCDYKSKGIVYYHGESTLNKGDRIFLHKKIYRIKAGDCTDFSKYLMTRGVHFTGSVTDRDITLIKKHDAPIRSYMQKLLLGRIDKLFKNSSAGIIKALFTGNKSYIDKKTIISFRNSGVLHILSASGLHVAIFASIPAFLLIPFFRRNTAALISFFFVFFYLFITDMPVSLLRAAVMYGLFFFQLLLFRQRNLFNYLMITCSIILIISPWEIFSPGFQLSFSATAGIIIFYRQFRNSLKNFPGIIADSVAVSLSAQVFTVPIVLFSFNQFNTAGIFSNIIIIPLITITMWISMITIAVSLIYIPVSYSLGNITGLLLKLILFITDFISHFRLNFFIYGFEPVLLILIMTGFIPLINLKAAGRLKFYPVLLSIMLCTLYLKKIHQTDINECNTPSVGHPTVSIKFDGKKQVLKLDLKNSQDINRIVTNIKSKNADISIIELADSSYNNIITSNRILNDYNIDEVRFNGIPEPNFQFKTLAFLLEKDNIPLKYITKNKTD